MNLSLTLSMSPCKNTDEEIISDLCVSKSYIQGSLTLEFSFNCCFLRVSFYNEIEDANISVFRAFGISTTQ